MELEERLKSLRSALEYEYWDHRKYGGNPDETAHLQNFTYKAQAAYERLDKAKSISPSALGSANAAYGAVMKNWHRFLITELTRLAYEENDWRDLKIGREFAREWQKRLFGKSVSATELAKYAANWERQKCGRKGLERKKVSEEVEEICQTIWNSEKDALRRKATDVSYDIPEELIRKASCSAIYAETVPTAERRLPRAI